MEMSMRKSVICIVIAVFSLTIFLSGCIKIDISTGVDADFTAYLTYNIEMDVSELDASYQELFRNAVHRIGWHYHENLGFIVEMDVNSDPCTLVMTRRVLNNSYEQAFKSLEFLLTNENITPFMQVDMAFESVYRQNRYIFNAETDILQILRLSNAEELSPALQEQLRDAITTGVGSITVELPASEVVSSSHQVRMLYHQATLEAPLHFVDRTGVELTGVLNLQSDGTPGGSLDDIIHELTMNRRLSIIISCAVLVILLIIALLVKLLRSGRTR